MVARELAEEGKTDSHGVDFKGEWMKATVEEE